MTQTLSSNKLNRLSSVYFDCLARYKSVFILYSVLMAVAGPVFLVPEIIEWMSRPAANRYFYGLTTEVLFHFVALAMSCLLPLLLFSYINSRQAVDVYHAMPVTRDKLYWGNVLGGATILMAPYLIFGIPCGIVCELLDNTNGMLSRVAWIGIGMLALYSTMVFIMVNCGTLFESIVYFGIVQIGYPLMILVIMESLGEFTFGWNESITSGVPSFLAAFAPGYLLVEVIFGSGNADWRIILQPVVTSAVALILGMVLYRKRRSESAGASFAFKPLFYIGSIMTSIAAGVGCSLIFDSYGGLMTIISAIVGILCYFILDTIRNRGLSRVKETALVSLGGVVAVGMFYGLAYLTGTFGYEDHIPVETGVKSVAVQWRVGNETYLSNSFAMTDDENIARVINAHEAIVANKKAIRNQEDMIRYYVSDTSVDGDYARYSFDDGSGNGWEYGTCYVVLRYTMVDGRTICRRYNNVPVSVTEPLYEAAGSGAYRDLQWVGLAEAVDSGEMYKATSWNFNMNQADGWVGEEFTNEKAVDLAKAMIADLESRPDDWNVHPESVPISELELYPYYMYAVQGLSSYSMKIYARDVNTIRWLKQHGYAVDENEYSSSSGQDIVAEGESTSVSVDTAQLESADVTYPSDGTYERRIVVLRAEDRENFWQDYQMMFHFGGYDGYFYELEKEGYEIPLTMISEADLQQLLSKASSHYISEEPRDVLIVDGDSYLVYPEYSEWMLQQGYNYPDR